MLTACRWLELQHAVPPRSLLSRLSGLPAIRGQHSSRPQDLLLEAVSHHRQESCCCPVDSGPWLCRERSSNTLTGCSPGSVAAASRQSDAKGSKMTQEQRDALLQEVDRDLHRQVYSLSM